jgi:hypothetical protein
MPTRQCVDLALFTKEMKGDRALGPPPDFSAFVATFLQSRWQSRDDDEYAVMGTSSVPLWFWTLGVHGTDSGKRLQGRSLHFGKTMDRVVFLEFSLTSTRSSR